MSFIQDKLSRPIRDLRISLIDTCNYRCSYCMPEQKFGKSYQFLKPDQRLSFDEIIKTVKVFAKLGVNKVRLTGGEPLLRKNIPILIKNLKSIEGISDLALTTNGQLLNRHLDDLIASGLDRINISLDTLDPELYYENSGQKGRLEPVLTAIENAANSSLKSIKINCVLQKNINDSNYFSLLKKYQDSRIQVRFIEFMDVGNKNKWNIKKVVPFEKVYQSINSKWPLKPSDQKYYGEVASRYKYLNHKGEIGFINSITKPFCGECTRARLSADGKLYTCLFANQFHDLKPIIKNQNSKQLEQKITEIWHAREDRYSEMRNNSHNQKKVEMYVIGG